MSVLDLSGVNAKFLLGKQCSDGFPGPKHVLKQKTAAKHGPELEWDLTASVSSTSNMLHYICCDLPTRVNCSGTSGSAPRSQTRHHATDKNPNTDQLISKLPDPRQACTLMATCVMIVESTVVSYRMSNTNEFS